MSLINPHSLTAEGRAARRRNGRRSRGAVTPEGKERSRAANLKHGLYSQEREQALRALGEDPADLARLLEGCHQQWQPANLQQADLVERLGHLQWRMNRAARREESLQARHLEKVDAERREKTLRLRYHNQDQTDWLSLAYSHALRPDFYATRGCLARFQQAFAGEMQSRLERILDLLHRLREPAQLPPALPLPPGAASDENWQQYLALDAEDGAEAVPGPEIPIAEGEERDELREELRYLVQQEHEAVDAVWEPFFAKHLAPMTLAERDEAVMVIEGQLERLRREEESCLRQFWRLTNLLMKMQDRKDRQESAVCPAAQSPRAAGRGPQSEVRSPESGNGKHQAEGGGQEREAQSGGFPKRKAGLPEAAPARPQPTATGSVSHPARNPKNAGATGDVIENKGHGKQTEVQKDRRRAQNSASAAPNKQQKPAAGGFMAG